MTKQEIEKMFDLDRLEIKGIKSDSLLSATFYFLEENAVVNVPSKTAKSRLHKLTIYEVGSTNTPIRKYG